MSKSGSSAGGASGAGRKSRKPRASSFSPTLAARGTNPQSAKTAKAAKKIKPKKAGLKPLSKSDQAAVKAAGGKKGKAAAELRLAASVRATIAKNNRKRGS